MNVAKRLACQERELARLKKQQARPKSPFYIAYLFLILTLIYIVDEVATNSAAQLEDLLITAFFPNDTASVASSNFSIISTVALVLMILSCFYKPLADRFGRKPFLILNTFGIAASMMVCSLAVYAHSFALYAVGFVLMKWFVTPDEQVVYIFETAPQKWRATVYSIIKGVAEFGLFPWFRRMFITDGTPNGVRFIFLTIAICGAVAAFLSLFFARETDAYLNQRIAYLELSEEEKEALKKKKMRNEKQQGGLIHAFVHSMTHRQLLFIMVATTLYTLARAVTEKHAAILAIEGFSTEFITLAQFILPVGAGILTILYGLFSDRIGRKITVILMLALTTIFFGLFVISFRFTDNPYLVGCFIGLYLAAYWGTGDTFIMMAGESAPTNLRASVLSVQSLFYGMGQVISGVILSIGLRFVDETYTWLLLLIMSVPCFLASIFVTMFLTKETHGRDIEETLE